MEVGKPKRIHHAPPHKRPKQTPAPKEPNPKEKPAPKKTPDREKEKVGNA